MNQSYRAKRVDTTEWVYGALWYQNGLVYIIRFVDSTEDLVVSFPTATLVEVDEDTVNKCVGVDSDLHSVYEKDFVEVTYYDYDSDGTYKGIVYVPSILRLPDSLRGSNVVLKKVVGNIYDNPDMRRQHDVY